MAPLQFGILMIPYQTIDVAMPLDVLSCCSKSLFELLVKFGDPQGQKLIGSAIDLQFHHINTTMDPVDLTGGFKVLPSTTVADCPPLDYLICGGPDVTTFELKPEFAQFVKDHVAAGKGLFTTCSGAMALASSGIFDGRKATTNHEGLDMAMKVFPKVKWVKEQWVEDGNIWTAGGACAGMDMIAHWVMKNYGKELAKKGFKSLDFVPRDVEGKQIIL